MKRTGVIIFAVLLSIFLISCSNKTEPQKLVSQESKENSQNVTKEASVNSTLTETIKEPISKEEGLELAFNVYNKYCQATSEESSDYQSRSLHSKEELKISDKLLNLDESMGYGYNYFELRERIPGKYAAYVSYEKSETAENDSQLTNQPMSLCLYVNLDTKQVFEDCGFSGIYRLPSDDMVVYVPYAIDGYNDNNFLLTVLASQNIIENKYDYMAEWFKEDFDYNQPPDYEEAPADIIRIPIIHTADGKRVGIYDINTVTRTVTDYNTKKILYQDPLTQYKKKTVTQNNAAEETAVILEKLHELDHPTQEYTFETEKFQGPSDLSFDGYGVRAKAKKSGSSEKERLYAISEDGTRVLHYNEEDGMYYFIYGTLMGER